MEYTSNLELYKWKKEDKKLDTINGMAESMETLDKRLSDIGINVKNKPFGAKGDGVTDDTAAIQAAINHLNTLGGGVLLIPKGDYLVTATLNLYSDITIQGNGRILFNGSTLFSALGSLGSQIALSAHKTTGDTSISLVSDHGLAVDDLVYFVSQRDSLSSDAGDEWRLGYATPTSPGCYFGEFGRVKTISNATQFTLASGLIFPSYRADNTAETATTARSAATVQKFFPIKNVTIKGITIKGSFTMGVLIQYGFNCRVEEVKFIHDNDGTSVSLKNSLSCDAFRCENFYTSATTAAQIYSRNGFKTVSSQASGFVQCYSENASQAFDLTYASQSTPSVHCYIKDCETKGATTNAATSHGGTYACQFLDNLFVDNLKNGLSVRSRSSLISGNRVFGCDASLLTTYGIALYEAWARDCVIEGNSISGFGYGVQLQDGANEQERFKWVGALIKNNTITYCYVGIDLDRSSLNKHLQDAGVLIQSNTIKNMRSGGKCIRVQNYVIGTDIKDNILDASSTGNACIYGFANCGDMRITGNKMMNSTSRAVWIESVSDTTSFPNGIEITHNNNRLLNIANSVSFNFGTNVRGYSMPKQTASSALNNTLFIDSADNKLKYKGADGTMVILG